MHHLSEEDFRLINWISTSKRVDQNINTITFKFAYDNCHYYLKEIFEFVTHCRIKTKNWQNLKFVFAQQRRGRKLFHSLVILCRTVYLK